MSDLETQIPDTDYFFLGNGHITVAVQWSRHPGASPYGLIVHDAERTSRKNGSFLLHPELGLSRTMLTVIVQGVRHRPRHENVRVSWSVENVPTVIIRWDAGAVQVTEQISIGMGAGGSELRRTISLSADRGQAVALEIALYANPLIFNEFGIDNGALYASGYASLSIHANPHGHAFERFLTIPVALHQEDLAATILYKIDLAGTAPAPPSQTSPWDGRLMALSEEGEAASRAARMSQLYEVSRISLRAAVAERGRFDASIWQYDFEWGMDAAMVATAAAHSGLFELARQVLQNILQRLTNDDGMVAEASRFRGGEMSELNGNGAVLDALWQYWQWSGDETIARNHRTRIRAIAEYLLRPEFQHASGLLKTRRDLWERTPWMGVGEGFELGHQVYGVIGLRHAAKLAEAFRWQEEAARWRHAAERIHDAMLHHPTWSLVEDGRFIHRRLLDGSVQTHLAPDPGYRRSDYQPYISPDIGNDIRPRACQPDIAEALPLIYGLVDPSGSLARRTMAALEQLWNPTGIGGYARYAIDSDPDSPGPWAFATAFMAAAELESRLQRRTDRTIDWLLDMAGAGGSWFEYYGTRETPPFPPIGIIVWGWAQYIILVVRHALGVQVIGTHLRIAPKLVGIEHTLCFGGHRITLSVQDTSRAKLDGIPVELRDGGAWLALPLTADHRLEFVP